MNRTTHSKTEARLASLTVLLTSVVFVVAACDSGGANLDTTVADDSIQVSDVTPDIGTDLKTTDTSITLTFTKPVVENEYTRTNVEPSGGNRHLIDHVVLTEQTAKELAPNGSLPLDLEFHNDRATLSVVSERGLRDGFIYELSLGDSSRGTGFYDPRFKSEAGDRFAENPNLPDNLDFEFSVGMDTNRPDAPSVAFDTESHIVDDDGTPESEAYDYGDYSVTIPLRVNQVKDDVKGYEVYYRSQNQVGRSGNGDQFKKAFGVRPEAGPSEFEDYNGIIPANRAESIESGNRTLTFTATVGEYPFEATDASYGPVEWKVRAVSINNIRGSFSDVLRTRDNTPLSLLGWPTEYDNRDDSDDLELVVTFDEPVDPSSINTTTPSSQFSIDNGGSGDLTASSVIDINVTNSGYGEVVIELSGTSSSTWDDVLTIEQHVTDLAGNVTLSTGDSYL